MNHNLKMSMPVIIFFALFTTMGIACEKKVDRKQEMQPLGPHAFQKMEKVWQYENGAPNSLYRTENNEVVCYVPYSDSGIWCYKKNEPAQ